MGIFDKLFKKKEPEKSWMVPEAEVTPPMPKVKKPRKPKVKKEPPVLSDKDKATSEGLPWVNVVKIDVDDTNINSGSFTLDWNDKFVLNLIKSGYKQKEEDTEAIVVDRWFQTVCRNVALELYEQQIADPTKRDAEDIRRIQSRNLGDGRVEVS